MADPKIRSIPALQPRLKARLIVASWVDATTDKSDDTPPINPDTDIYVVWFAKTLQNWKCLLSTTRPDGMYYEVTYNGDKQEAYLDCYKKVANGTYPDSMLRGQYSSGGGHRNS